jgi:hypothetical protein
MKIISLKNLWIYIPLLELKMLFMKNPQVQSMQSATAQANDMQE